MATQGGSPGRWAVHSRWAVRRGIARATRAHLVIVTLGVWAFLAFEDLRERGDLLRAPVVAAAAVGGFGLGGLVFVTVLLIPAMVLAIVLVHRFEANARAARAAIGAFAWAGWCLFVAMTLAVTSRVVLVPESIAAALVLLAAAGAGFSLLAFDGSGVRPGRALTLLAVVVTASVILGSIWMAGRWGGAA